MKNVIVEKYNMGVLNKRVENVANEKICFGLEHILKEEKLRMFE